MKSFTERVKRDQEKHEELHIFRVSKDKVPILREPIDLIGMKNGKITFIRCRGNGHGKLQQRVILQLQVLGKKCGARVLHASVNSENEICFKIIYERK